MPPENMPDPAEQQVLDLSADEADELLKQMTSQPADLPPPEEAPPEPEAAAPAEEESPPQEAEPKQPPQEEPPAPPEPDYDLNQSYVQEIELLTKRAEQAERRRDVLAGTYGSEVDGLRKQMALLQSQLQQRAVEPEDVYREPSTSAQPTHTQADPTMGRLQQMEEFQRQQALEAAYNQFLQEAAQDFQDEVKSSPDFLNTLQQDLAPVVQEKIKEHGNVFQSLPTAQVGKFVRMVLDSALTDYQLGRIRTARAEALKRKADQVPQHRKVADAAAISGAGASSSPPPKAKSVEEMTAEEADKWLVQRFGDGHSRRPRRM